MAEKRKKPPRKPRAKKLDVIQLDALLAVSGENYIEKIKKAVKEWEEEAEVLKLQAEDAGIPAHLVNASVKHMEANVLTALTNAQKGDIPPEGVDPNAGVI